MRLAKSVARPLARFQPGLVANDGSLVSATNAFVGILSREMIRRIICKVLRLVWRRSPTLRTHNPLTSNSRAMSFRNGASSCRTYSGSANRRRCATRNLSARTAVRRAITRATRLESPFRRPLTTPRTQSAAELALMNAITNFDCRY